MNSSEIRLVCAYLSPSGTADALLVRTTELCDILEVICNHQGTVCVAGDFNRPSIDWEIGTSPSSTMMTKEKVFLDCCCKLGLSQHVSTPTRTKSSNILDLVLCNDESIADATVTNNPISSDHSAVMFTLDVIATDDDPSDTLSSNGPIYDYDRADVEMIKFNLGLTDWSSIFAVCPTVDAMYNRLTSSLRFLRELHVPQRLHQQSDRSDVAILTINRRLVAEQDNAKLAVLQRKLERLVHRKRVVNEYKVIQANDPKKFYKYIATKLKTKDHLSVLRGSNGELVMDDT